MEKDTALHYLPELSDAFFHGASVTFQRMKNILKARFGALWKKKLAYHVKPTLKYKVGQGMQGDLSAEGPTQLDTFLEGAHTRK